MDTKFEKPHLLWLLKFNVQFSSEMSTRRPIRHVGEIWLKPPICQDRNATDRACFSYLLAAEVTSANVRQRSCPCTPTWQAVGQGAAG